MRQTHRFPPETLDKIQSKHIDPAIEPWDVINGTPPSRSTLQAILLAQTIAAESHGLILTFLRAFTDSAPGEPASVMVSPSGLLLAFLGPSGDRELLSAYFVRRVRTLALDRERVRGAAQTILDSNGMLGRYRLVEPPTNRRPVKHDNRVEYRWDYHLHNRDAWILAAGLQPSEEASS